MRMDDETLKRILKEGMEYDADCIMNEVNSDPNLEDVIAPEEIYTNIKKQIQEYKDADAKAQEAKAREDQELIRLGKIYRKNRSRRKYIVLIAAAVCALGIGTISFGDGKKVFTEIKRVLTGRERTVINAGSDESSFTQDIANEAEAYEQIEKKFGFAPVKMYYMPEGMDFVEMVIEDDIQSARICYADTKDRVILYCFSTNYRTSSMNIDIEDELIGESYKEIEGTNVKIQQYVVNEDKSNRWVISFIYKDTQYSILLHKLKEKEVEKVIENLYFS